MKSKDFDTITLEELSNVSLKLGKARTVVKLYNTNKKQLQFKSPEQFTIPFGASIDKFKTYTSYNEYYMECSVSDEFKEFFNKFEGNIYPLIEKNVDLFDKIELSNVTEETIKKAWKSPIRTNEYGHLFHIKLPRNNVGDFDFTVWDQDSKILYVDDSNISTVLKRFTKFTAVVRISKIWGYKEQYGMILNLEQLKLGKPEPERETNTKSVEAEEYLFLD